MLNLSELAASNDQEGWGKAGVPRRGSVLLGWSTKPAHNAMSRPKSRNAILIVFNSCGTTDRELVRMCQATPFLPFWVFNRQVFHEFKKERPDA